MEKRLIFLETQHHLISLIQDVLNGVMALKANV